MFATLQRVLKPPSILRRECGFIETERAELLRKTVQLLGPAQPGHQACARPLVSRPNGHLSERQRKESHQESLDRRMEQSMIPGGDDSATPACPGRRPRHSER